MVHYCNICNKSFTNKSNCTRHEKQCTYIPPFEHDDEMETIDSELVIPPNISDSSSSSTTAEKRNCRMYYQEIAQTYM